MNSRNNQDIPTSPLMQGIQNEVSEENAPLLRFMTRYAGIISGVVIALLLILGGWAVWDWHSGARRKDTLEELYRIQTRLNGEDKAAALSSLAKLAEDAPESLKLFLCMGLGKSAMELGDHAMAVKAYSQAAEMDGKGALGLAAALGKAGALLKLGEYKEALEELRQLEAKLPPAESSPQLRSMLAEAAVKTGNLELAQKTYGELANIDPAGEGAYYRSRAEAIGERIKSGKKDSASPEKSAENKQ